MLGRFVQVYCDDILIFSNTREEVHVRMVLETPRHHKLYAKASKCQFGRSSVRWSASSATSPSAASLGRRRRGMGDADVVHGRAPLPGLANYDRKFVLRFSALAAPLTALCSPRAQFT